MTRGEAIDALDNLLGMVEDNHDTDYDEAIKMAIDALKQPERKKGKWTEKEVIHMKEAKTAIEEWQSCRCSVCGRYDTRPYMYYFNEPHFCSWCGARMTDEVNG